MKRIFLLVTLAAWWINAIPTLQAQAEFPQVHRSFVPEAGPSAFVVTLSSDCVLIYDPLRGGINAIYHGKVDFSPTLRAKINDPAEFSGKVVYQESQLHPLNVTGSSTTPSRQFLGYRYENEAVTFRFRLNGILIEERLQWDQSRRRLTRTLTYPKTTALTWILEPQTACRVLLEDGSTAEPGQISLPKSGTFQLTIAPHSQP